MLKKCHKSFQPFFESDDIRDELNDIFSKIGDNFYPNKENVLRFANCDLNKIKCIIVGMEPYPSSCEKNGKIIPEATGRSFEVASLSDKTWSDKFKQSSLRNILKTIYYNETGNYKSLDEIRNEIKNGTFKILNPKDWFDKMEEQGVLFLNATLTVIPGEVATHTEYWNVFMNELIKYIMINNPDVKWLLWGKDAQHRILIHDSISTKNTICTCHPRLAQFVKENCFGKIKDINWTGV